MNPPATTELESNVLNQGILAEQVKAVYKQSINAFVGNALGAVILSFVLWDIKDHSLVALWLSALCTILFLRLVLFRLHKQKKKYKISNQTWLNMFMQASFISGALWGAAGYLFLSSDTSLYNAIITIFILAISTGGLIGYAANLKVALSFFLPCMLPLIISLLTLNDPIYSWIGIGLFAFVIFAPVTLLQIHKWIIQAIQTNMQLQQTLKTQAQVEVELRESESRFKSLFNNSPDPCWIIDENNQFLICNRAAALALGYESIADLEATYPAKISPDKQPDGADSFAKSEEMMAIAHRKGVHRFEWTHQRKNGETFPVEVTLSHIIEGEEKRLYCVWRDISARKISEESLRKLSQAVEQAGESIIITDKKGTIEYTNPSFTRMTGYSNGEVMGKNPRVLKSGNQTPEFYIKLWQTITSGKVWTGAISDRRKDGSTYPAIMSISPIFDEDKQITHYVGIQQDMTEHQLLEEKFFQAQKMEAIGTLVGGIAHDFNNILAGITGNLYLAKARTKDDADSQRLLSSVELLSFRAADLIKQLLTFARKDRVSMKPIPLTAFIKETFKLLRSGLPENIEVHMDTCEEVLTVNGDATQLHQVLMNLVTNARDAVKDTHNPSINISLQSLYIDDVLAKEHVYLDKGYYAHLVVSDNGSGIPDNMRAQVFDPFFTTKEQGKGTGLGLAMVFGAIKTHQGFVEVGQTDTQGTSIHVYIPLLDGNQTYLPSDLSAPVQEGRGELILLVDDEVEILDVGTEILEALGYQTLCAKNGLEAVEVYEANIKNIDLVITDIVMPKLSGVQAAERIKKLNPNVKVIYTTGYDKKEAFPDLMSGTNHILTKPYNVETLSKTIAERLNS